MKKIQIILAAVAIMAAGAGVFANARAAFITTYYRAADADFGDTGALCGVALTGNPGCTESTPNQCFKTFSTQLPNETFPTDKTYFISKIVDSGNCEIVRRAN